MSSETTGITLQTLTFEERDIYEAQKTAQTLRASVVARLGNQQFAIEMGDVKEVLAVALNEVTPLPFVPNHVFGVMSVRGSILPVIDLRPLLELAADRPGGVGRVVVIESAKSKVGLWVESVETIESSPSDMEDLPESPSLICGRLKRANNLIAVLSTSQIINKTKL